MVFRSYSTSWFRRYVRDHADYCRGGISDFYFVACAGQDGMLCLFFLFLRLSVIFHVAVDRGSEVKWNILLMSVKWLLPKYFSDSELRILDAPTASPFTMVSVGGNYGEEEDGHDGSGEATAVPSGRGSDGEGVLVGGSKFLLFFIAPSTYIHYCPTSVLELFLLLKVEVLMAMLTPIFHF